MPALMIAFYGGKEYKNLEACPMCKVLRYKIRRDEDPGALEGTPPKTTKLPAKVMWYFPIIVPRARTLRWPSLGPLKAAASPAPPPSPKTLATRAPPPLRLTLAVPPPVAAPSAACPSLRNPPGASRGGEEASCAARSRPRALQRRHVLIRLVLPPCAVPAAPETAD
jgi:hypothetical protein